MSIQRIIDHYDFTEEEKEFLRTPPAESVQKQTQSRVVSEFVLGKKIEYAADKVIESNKKLSESNERHSTIML